MAPVHGRLTNQGKPVGGATLTFLCAGAPRPAIGKTDETGNYQLTTFEPNDGAIVAEHVVTVNIYGAEPDEEDIKKSAAQGDKSQSQAIAEAMKRTIQENKKVAQAAAVIPAKFKDRRTSDLHKQVIAGDNVINIELAN
ncbi:MAG TPA: hypothetical protein VHU84_11350 [Lacipirellulaceae bacterium]|nr:hypothetical protein [Lacipirellulaceae bacterium]